MAKASKAAAFRPVRRDRLLEAFRHDPYRMHGKPREPAVCHECGAVFHAGRWQWGPRPGNARELRCPACQRIASGLPAGFLWLSGEFVTAHRQEIMHLLEHTTARESGQHPLERMISIAEEADGRLLVRTTGIHLARRLAEALHAAYQGRLRFNYNDGEMLLRAHWRR